MRKLLARTPVKINNNIYEPGTVFESKITDEIRKLLDNGNLMIIG